MNAEPYTPGSDDAAIEMLREIFGTAITHIVGGNPAGAENAAANMLGAAFGFFNGGVLFFGSIILTWVTVFGLTNTANDGQVLGKKWSTFYTPLRTFTASALLIPSTSGYSIIQLAVLLLVTWSVGFASNMWGRVVDATIDNTITDQVLWSIYDDKQFDRTAFNIFKMQVCSLALADGVNQTTGSQYNFLLHPQFKQIKIGDATTYQTRLDFRDPRWPGSEDVCGELVLSSTLVKVDTNRASVSQVNATLADEIANLQGIIGNYCYMSTMDMFSKMEPLAREVVRIANSTDPNEKFSVNQLQAVIDQSREAMLKDIRDEVSRRVAGENSGLKAKLKKGGWVMAGSLHRELIAIKDGIRNAMTTQQQFISGTYSPDHLLAGGAVSTSINTVMARYNTLAGFIVKGIDERAQVKERNPTDLPSIETGLGPEDFADGGKSVKTQITAWFNGLANSAMQGIVFFLAKDTNDPVMQVKSLGDWMISFAETLKVTKVALVATVDGLFEGSKVAASQTVLGTNAAAFMAVGPGVMKFILTLIQETWAMVEPGVDAMLYGGYFLGMWLPMVPFYVFSLGVIGWLVQVVESLAACSLWMVMHLTPEKDDSFIGSQQQGYLLLMSLFARPPLMVLGLVASMSILTPAVRYINAGFMMSFRIIQADSVTGLLSLAGYTLIYGVIIFAVFMLVFSLPQTLPDRILRWVGAGISDLGEQNTMSRIESGASGQAKAAAVAGAAGMARRTQERKETRRADAGERDEADGARPEGHTK